MNKYEIINGGVDTTVAIWDILYKVKVPYLESRSEEDIQRFGTYLSNVKAIDKDVHKDMLVTMVPISKMVEYFKDGVPIAVIKDEDTKIIYEAIQEHLHAWQERLDVGINIGDAPIDDLILMDEFAETLFEVAKHKYETGVMENLVVRRLGFNNRIGPHNFFKSGLQIGSSSPDGVTRINNDDVDDGLPTRDSLSEFLKDKLIKLR